MKIPLSHPRRAWRSTRGFLPVILLGLACQTLVAASRFDVQVVDNLNGRPLSNARVTLDLDPADGNPEHTAGTGGFGFVALTNLTAGTYTLKVEQAGYTPHMGPVTFDGASGQNGVIRLNPVEVMVTFQIHFQVNGLATQAPLPGTQVRVDYWRPDGDLSGPADQVFQQMTDAAGALTLAGMVDGFYTFVVTKTGWEALAYSPPAGEGLVVSDGKVRLIRSHFATVLLKPVRQNLTVRIKGYDPVEDEPNVPLKGMTLKLTGVDGDGNTLLPTQSAVSGEDGQFTFTKLPPVAYRLEVGRLGYQRAEVVIVPDLNAAFPTFPNVEEVTVDLLPTRIKASLASLYQSTKPLVNAVIRLEGLRDSSASGISRTNLTVADTNFTASTVFQNLLPGRYWLHVKHGAQVNGLPFQSGPIFGPTSFTVSFFPKESYAEVAPGAEEVMKIELTPIPAIVRGRLLATDQEAELEEDPYYSESRRVFRQVAHDGIEFVEWEATGLLTNRTVAVVDTDESGAYTAAVIPGIHGVRIPTMTDYTGHNAEFGNLTAGQAPHNGPWPYPDAWPYPVVEFGHHGSGHSYSSGQEYQLDLFVHAHHIHLYGQVNVTGSPFGDLILFVGAEGEVFSTPYNHLRDVGAMVELSGPVSDSQPVRADKFYLFKNLVPGTYTITMNHPDYTASPVNVTIAPWQAPGIIPATEPFEPGYFFPGIAHDAGISGRLFLDWNTKGTIEVNRSSFNTETQEYNNSGTSPPGYFTVASLPGKVFSFVGFSGGIPKGSYTIWDHFGGWYPAAGSGSQTFAALNGGPLDNTPAMPTPTSGRTYQLDLRAVSSSDRTVLVPDVQVSFGEGLNATANDVITHTATPRPESVTHLGNQWQQSFQFPPIIEVVDPSVPLVRTTIFMDRLMTVSGTVTSGGLPVAGAAVVVRNRFGVQVGSAVTSANGTYAVFGIIAQTAYVDVNLRGFVQQRIRFPLTDPNSPDLTAANVSLTPVPPPDVNSFTMNRFGAFLPGVSKAADSAGFDPNAARQKLTVTWKADATGKSFPVTLAGFVQGNGSLGAAESFTVNDRVAEVWLVDRRAFHAAFINQTDQTDFTVLTPPAPLNYATLKPWLEEIRSAKKNGDDYFVIHQLATRPVEGLPGQYEGRLPLWELPSGVFSPMLIAITQAGGVAVKNYELPAGQPSLQGMNLPSWASFLLEIVGAGANVPTLSLDVLASFGDKFLKVGELQPSLQARIGLDPFTNDPPDDSTLSYKYVVGVEMPIGDHSAVSGPLAYGPRYFGLKLSALDVEFELVGKDKQATLALVATSAKPEEVDELKARRDKDYTPVFLEVDDGGFDSSVAFSAKLGAVQEIEADAQGRNRISKKGYVVEGQGVYEFTIRRDATPVLSKLPYAGPVLYALGKTGLFKALARVEGTIGGKATYSAKTTYPEPASGGSTTGEEGTPLLTLLGQVEAGPDIENSLELKMIARIAAGIELKGGSRPAGQGPGATGILLVQLGAPNGASDVDGVFATVNTDALWPPFKQIEGAASIVGRLSVNLLVARYNKSLKWDIHRFIWKLVDDPAPGGGTRLAAQHAAPTDTGLFELWSIDETFVEITAGNSPEPRFVGSEAVVVDDFYAAGSHAISSDGGLLVYTGTDPATGEMTVLASTRNGALWNTPVELARAGGIASVVTTTLADGRRLIAWSELSLADVSNPFATTKIRHVISDPAGTAWSTATDISAVGETAFDLRLVALGNEAVLTFRCTSEGPFGENCSLHTTAFNSTSWSSPTELLPNHPLLGHDLASDGTSKALAVAITLDGGLVAFVRSESTWGASSEVANGTALPLSARFDGNGAIATLWADTAGALRISRHDCASGTWTHLGPVIPGVFASDAQILPLNHDGSILYLVSWIEGSDTATLWHSFLAADGSVLLPRREIAIVETGTHARLALQADDGPRAFVYTPFTRETTSLRRYQVGLPSPGDCNGNGIPDATEISSGTAMDLNGNGIPDHCEIADGLLADRNRNGIPDEFEEAPAGDLNRNGFADLNEVFAGLLVDGNENQIPDDFELFPRTLQINPGQPTQFYRAPRIIIRTIRANDFDADVLGTKLERADQVTGPWIIVE